MRRNPLDQRTLLSSTLLHVRSGKAISRSALSRLMGASASTLGIYVDQLIAMGYLIEEGKEKNSIGRPQRLLALRPEAGWFLGLEFHALRIQATCVDFAGKPLDSKKVHLPEVLDTQILLEALVKVTSEMLATQGRPPLSIGIGVPGLLDRKSGISRYIAFLHDWKDMPLAAYFTQHFQVPTVIENNLRVLALAERWFGAASHLQDYLILGIRAGVGVGLVIGGELVRGAHQSAGEVGFWAAPFSEQSIHQKISAPSLYRRLIGLPTTTPLPQPLRPAFENLLPSFESYLRHFSLGADAAPHSLTDPATSSFHEWDQVITEIAHLSRHLQLLTDPQVQFLHGPLTSLGSPFCEKIVQRAHQLSPKVSCLEIDLRPSTLSDDAGALGAASLAMESWQPTP